MYLHDDSYHKSNGLIGIAPIHGRESFINALWEENIISDKVVGLSYGDSRIDLGFIDGTNVQNGTAALIEFSNVRSDVWALQMKQAQFGKKNNLLDGLADINAVIDSSNFTI